MLPDIICLNIPQTSPYFFLRSSSMTADPVGRAVYSRCSAAAHLVELRVRIPPEFRCLSLVRAVFWRVEVSAKGRSLFHRSPTERGLSVYDLDTSTLWRSRPEWGCCATRKSSIMTKMRMECWWNYTDIGQPKYSERNLSQCHFV